MKKVFVLLLVLVWCQAASGQKVTFRLHAAATYPVIPDVEEEAMFDVFMPPTEGQSQVPQQERGISHTTFNQKPGGRLGGIVGIEASPKFTLETGLQASLIRFQIGNEIIFPDAASSDAVLRRWRNVDDTNTRTAAFTSNQDPKAGNTSVLYVELPLAARYKVHRFVDLKAGISASMLAYSERYIYHSGYLGLYAPMEGSHDPHDPYWTSASASGSYGTDTSGGSFNKLLMSFTTGITLKATERLGLDIDYSRYITPIYKTQAEKHPHTYNLFSLGMSYVF